ncbi:MAG TPA: oxygen-independent coproporphyrinogen III oxidase [Ferruginibacter sp.]|nr:oxygen-independent coproporphyrinogen III oxidase [Ferruginibacter sp.]HMP22247.1 oxygen-independent coproporphyrinogen III oxidase [Ferruginibacter sp.]
MADTDLLNKYNVPVPRYTSYPTVPYWRDDLEPMEWLQAFEKSFTANNSTKGISLYIHLPFCESLCTYCGCNKKITSNHEVEQVYIKALLKEWAIYRSRMNTRPVIKELHLGGGTPTFFSPSNLTVLLENILKDAALPGDVSFSVEGHPNNTTREHLQALYRAGFRRVSYGVQDHDERVQQVINRIQPFENVRRATETARELGFTSVNFDLIYGLPLQTPDSMRRTIAQSISLHPDRIAFYSYAHVPWKSRMQRLFDENDLPSAAVKMQLYQCGHQQFMAAGYTDIGMDHFALPHDELHKAWQQGWLHRNFMGYTTQHTGLLLGLGVSAISDTGNAYAQNNKSLQEYYRAAHSGIPATQRGCILTATDRNFKQYILDIACKGYACFKPEDAALLEQYSFPELKKLAADGLVDWDARGASLTAMGRDFTRNICRAFDLYLLQSRIDTAQPVFSRAV